MIIAMKKYAFMVFHKEYDAFLSTLRDLGVVHIKDTKPIAEEEELQKMIAEHNRVNTLMREFKRLNEQNQVTDLAPGREISKEEGLKLVQEIEGLQEHKQQLLALRQTIEKDVNYMELWGDFSYRNICHLKENGFDVTFFTCPTSKFEPKWVEEYNAILINNFQSVTYFVTITKEGTLIEIDAEKPKMPDRGLSKLLARRDKLREDIKQTDDKLAALAASDYQTLDLLNRQLLDDFNLAHAVVQTDRQADDKLMFLEGWATAENAATLEAELDKDGYFYQELEIQEGDKVPVELKNGRFSSLYEPITKLYSLPNYGELDSTPLFAPFFMLFFGLCFGDGGYGLLILLLCTFLKKKFPAYKSYLSLFQWLGGMTLVVGALTGSFFGIALVDVPMFQSVKDYFLSSDNLMTLSIIIGIVHIIFGKSVAVYKTKMQKGVKHSIAPLGWVFVIASMAIALGLPFMDIQLPEIVTYICYGIAAIGLLAALFYNSPGKNILMNFGSGLWNAYNMIFGLLGDTLSYIRLFAVGLTGSILGGVFNSLAIDMTADMSVVPRFVIMLLILLAGHTINFGLCIISSLVHPIRLVFVEYYKNSEFEGGGKAYAPFKKA